MTTYEKRKEGLKNPFKREKRKPPLGKSVMIVFKSIKSLDCIDIFSYNFNP